ncbi:hypothetical protein [Sinomicrobium sp. M5D2P17]
MRKLILPLIYAFVIGCNPNYGQLKPLARLPKELKENSGIEIIERDSTIWSINDSGNKDHIYQVGFDGKMRRELKLKKAKNTDWEEITKDKDNNLYIGDFGNNSNKRKDLTIYKIPNPNTIEGKEIEAEKITFYYPEQKSFPPKAKHRYYDAEAFFFLNGYFYLFTKNRTSPFDGVSFLYKVPARKGHHKAELIGKYIFCTDDEGCRITAATISPDEKTVALLGYDKVWLFSGFTDDNFFHADIKEVVELGHSSQKEGLCFMDNHTLLISDEAKGSSGRNLYELKPDGIKN